MGLIRDLINFKFKYPFGFLHFSFKWEPKWYDFDNLEEQCPCCDYITLPERGISYKCPICYWEDDGHDIDQPDIASEVNNGITLREARKNFKDFGAFDEESIDNVEPNESRKDFEYIPRDL